MEKISDSIIDRIKKLLRLSTSSNVNEASNAAAKAQELIDRYKLDMAQVQVENPKEPGEQIEDDTNGIPCGQRNITWHWHILSSLCDANTCRAWSNYKFNRLTNKTHREYRLVGTKTNIEIVKYMYAYLVAEIERLSAHEMKFGQGKGNGKTWSNNFKIGAAIAIQDKLAATHKKVKQDYVGTQALAIIQKSEHDLTQYYEDLAKRLGLKSGASFSVRHDPSAREAGYKAGSNIHLGAALSGGSGKLLNK